MKMYGRFARRQKSGRNNEVTVLPTTLRRGLLKDHVSRAAELSETISEKIIYSSLRKNKRNKCLMSVHISA